MQRNPAPDLQFPDPDRRVLPGAQLELVVAQVRFEAIDEVADSSIGLALGTALDAATSWSEVRSQRSRAEGGARRRDGWEFSTDDGAWTITVLGDQVSLATARYTRWSDFSARLATVIAAVSNVLRPKLEQRLGLRYVDRLTRPRVEKPYGWNGWISEAFLGPLAHDLLGPYVRSTQQQLDVALGSGRSAIARHGAFPDPSEAGLVSYLLDFDVYRDGMRAFHPTALLAEMKEFNRLQLQLFQAAVTPALLDELARDEKDFE